jgi:anti-sigma factor RsiW
MNDSDERQLVERFARGLRQAPASCPSELELAAYADGRASEAEAVRIEAHLALCAKCLEGVIQARQLAAATPAAPSQLTSRAKALVAGWRPTSVRRRWRTVASWAAAAAAAGALGFAGLRAGTAASKARQEAAASVGTELSFEAPEQYLALLSSDDVLGILAPRGQEGHHE